MVSKIVSFRDDKYLGFVRLNPCCICGEPIVDAHHIGVGGISLKVSDLHTVPLCRIHHNEYHQAGHDTFEQKYKINLYKIIADILANYVVSMKNDQFHSVAALFYIEKYSDENVKKLKLVTDRAGYPFRMVIFSEDDFLFTVNALKRFPVVDIQVYNVSRHTTIEVLYALETKYSVNFSSIIPIEDDWLSKMVRIADVFPDFGVAHVRGDNLDSEGLLLSRKYLIEARKAGDVHKFRELTIPIKVEGI